MEYSGEYVNRKCNILGGYICEKLSYGFAGKTVKTSEFDQEMPQSQTNPRYLKGETQNADSHTLVKRQLK